MQKLRKIVIFITSVTLSHSLWAQTPTLPLAASDFDLQSKRHLVDRATDTLRKHGFPENSLRFQILGLDNGKADREIDSYSVALAPSKRLDSQTIYDKKYGVKSHEGLLRKVGSFAAVSMDTWGEWTAGKFYTREVAKSYLRMSSWSGVYGSSEFKKDAVPEVVVCLAYGHFSTPVACKVLDLAKVKETLQDKGTFTLEFKHGKTKEWAEVLFSE